jgi:hypothetical protein
MPIFSVVLKKTADIYPLQKRHLSYYEDLLRVPYVHYVAETVGYQCFSSRNNFECWRLSFPFHTTDWGIIPRQLHQRHPAALLQFSSQHL